MQRMHRRTCVVVGLELEAAEELGSEWGASNAEGKPRERRGEVILAVTAATRRPQRALMLVQLGHDVGCRGAAAVCAPPHLRKLHLCCVSQEDHVSAWKSLAGVAG
jgi:hypothetical protein